MAQPFWSNLATSVNILNVYARWVSDSTCMSYPIDACICVKRHLFVYCSIICNDKNLKKWLCVLVAQTCLTLCNLVGFSRQECWSELPLPSPACALSRCLFHAPAPGGMGALWCSPLCWSKGYGSQSLRTQAGAGPSGFQGFSLGTSRVTSDKLLSHSVLQFPSSVEQKS